MTDYLLSLATVPWKHVPRMFRSMWSELGRYFVSHEVKVIFFIVAFFLGVTPFATPAVYKLLNYSELEYVGYWSVKGDMYRITESIVSELQRRGIVFHYNTEITGVKEENSKIKAFIDQHGMEWEEDIFVSNSDVALFRGKILHCEKFTEEKLYTMHWTLAPFTIYLGVKGKIDGSQHHNYFLGTNFEEYANQIFKLSVNPEKPYYYVNVSSKTNPECAPEGCENLFILCSVPDLRYKKSWEDKRELANTIIDDLGKRVGYDIKGNIITQKIINPKEWSEKFNLYKGSGLGLANGINQIGVFHPANKDEKFSNLYYIGASTVPGTGLRLPIVVISSKLVTERIIHEHQFVS